MNWCFKDDKHGADVEAAAAAGSWNTFRGV